MNSAATTGSEPQTPRSAVLMVGASGMLSQAALQVSKILPVVVVARRKQRLDDLALEAAQLGGEIIGLAADYAEPGAVDLITAALDRHNLTCVRAVLWVHSHGRDFCLSLIRLLVALNPETEILHVLGSASTQPAGLAHEMLSRLEDTARTNYRQVVLGFALEGASSRWLTHAEISAGVLAALESNRRLSVVGVLEPWSRRP